MGGWPNFNGWLDVAWGSGTEYTVLGCWPNNATNLVFGQNPPFYLDDLLAMYPKFFGVPSSVTATTALGNNTVVVSSTSGLMIGQFVQCAGLPPGTLITAVGSGQITVNNNATAANTNTTLSAYTTPVIPVFVMQTYINLATASLVQLRWQDAWYLAIGWFVAHYLTLYAKSDATEILQIVNNTLHSEQPTGTRPGKVFTLSSAPPSGVLQALTLNGQFLNPVNDYTLNGTTLTTIISVYPSDKLWAIWITQTTVNTAVQPTAAKVAAQGLANGIQVSNSVGDVSVSYQALQSLENWGQWNLTTYGQMLATMAKSVGSGPMVIW